MRRLSLALLPFLALSMKGQGIRYDSSVTTSATNVPFGAQAQVLTVPYANITVCGYPAQTGPNNDCTNPVQVFSDQGLTQPVVNPIQADNLGRFGFFVAPGLYSYSVDTQTGTYVGTFTFSVAEPLAGLIDVSQFPGTCDQQIQAASTAYSGQNKTLWVINPCVIAAPVTLNPTLGLLVSAQITHTGNGYFIPTSHNTISCNGSGGFVNGGMTNVDSNRMNPFFFVPSGTAAANNLKFDDCSLEGGSNYATLYISSTATQGLQISRINAHNAELWLQQSATVASPATRFDVSNNDVNWDAGIDSGYYPIVAYGASNHGVVNANRVTNGRGGFEFFQVDPNGNPGAINPSYDTVYAQGLQDIAITNNVLKNIRGGQSPIFFSFAAHVLAEGNEIDGADDVGVDFEACVDSAAIGNTIKDDLTSGVGQFFTAVHNSFIDNHITVTSNAGYTFGVVIKNAGGLPSISTDTTISGNTYHYTGAGTGIFAYLETSSGLKMLHNDVTDGLVASGGGYLNGEVVNGNYFHYTKTLPGFGIGPAGFPGWGLPLFDNNNGSRMEASDNAVVTDVPQTVPCMSGLNSNSNPPNAFYYFTNNDCGGTWGDTVVNSGSTNAGVTPIFIFRNNQLPTTTIQKTTSTGNQPQYVSTGNYVTNSTTPVQ
jgi:hypothetical protein